MHRLFQTGILSECGLPTQPCSDRSTVRWSAIIFAHTFTHNNALKTSWDLRREHVTTRKQSATTHGRMLRKRVPRLGLVTWESFEWRVQDTSHVTGASEDEFPLPGKTAWSLAFSMERIPRAPIARCSVLSPHPPPAGYRPTKLFSILKAKPAADAQLTREHPHHPARHSYIHSWPQWSWIQVRPSSNSCLIKSHPLGITLFR